MSDVIHFPTKSQPSHVKSPEQALQYVLDRIKTGETEADNLVIAWSTEADDHISYRYMIGGPAGVSSTVGLLEITKSEMLK